MHCTRFTLCLLAGFLLLAVNCSALPAPEAKKTEQSVVSRLDPALRKALLEALSNLSPLEDDADETTDDDQTTETAVELSSSTDESSTDVAATTEAPNAGDQTTTAPPRDQLPSVQYHSYVVEHGGENESDNEIIRTIIVKSSDKQLSDNKVTDDDDHVANEDNTVGDGVRQSQAAIDPISSLSDAAADVEVPDNVQIARSVAGATANDISASSTAAPQKKATPPKFKTTTTTTTTTTTEAPTHNADGENIERVRADEVSIAQAPLVTAFTIQQDLSGRPNGGAATVFPHSLFDQQQQQQQQQQQAQQLIDFVQPQQIAYQQQQHQQHQQQPLFGQSAQLTALLEQRARIENDYRVQQQQYEQEIRAYRQQQAAAEARKNIQLKHLQFVEQQRQQQQQQQPQFVQAPPAVQQQQLFNSNVPQQQQQQQQQFFQQLPALQQQRVFQQQQEQHQQQQQQFLRPPTTAQVQIVPSVAFGSLATRQLLPAKQAVDFRQASQHGGLQFQAASSFALQQQQQQLPQLRAFQPFQGSAPAAANVEIQPAVGTALPSTLESVVQLTPRTRHFRQETGTGNLGFSGSVNDRDQRYLQAFLSQSVGGGSGHVDDFNIITRVLALNHGIPNAQAFLGGQQQF